MSHKVSSKNAELSTVLYIPTYLNNHLCCLGEAGPARRDPYIPNICRTVGASLDMEIEIILLVLLPIVSLGLYEIFGHCTCSGNL